MAQGDIRFGILLDTEQAEKAAQLGLVPALEDINDSLRNMGDNDGPEALERNLKDAQDQTRKLEKQTKETADAIDAEYKYAYRKLKESSGDALDKASSNTEEFKNEARQNFSEVTSSFDGSMSAVQDLAQGTLGGLASSLPGPAGFVAGGTALGIGLIGGLVSGIVEGQEEARQKVIETAKDMYESGQEALDAETVKTNFFDLYSDPAAVQSAKDFASKVGVNYRDVLLAEAGDPKALQTVQDAYNKAFAELPKQVGRGVNPARAEFARFTQSAKTNIDSVQQSIYLATDAQYAYSDAIGDSYGGANLTKVQTFNREISGGPKHTKVSLEVDTTNLDKALNGKTFTFKGRVSGSGNAGSYGRD